MQTEENKEQQTTNTNKQSKPLQESFKRYSAIFYSALLDLVMEVMPLPILRNSVLSLVSYIYTCNKLTPQQYSAFNMLITYCPLEGCLELVDPERTAMPCPMSIKTVRDMNTSLTALSPYCDHQRLYDKIVKTSEVFIKFDTNLTLQAVSDEGLRLTTQGNVLDYNRKWFAESSSSKFLRTHLMNIHSHYEKEKTNPDGMISHPDYEFPLDLSADLLCHTIETYGFDGVVYKNRDEFNEMNSLGRALRLKGRIEELKKRVESEILAGHFFRTVVEPVYRGEVGYSETDYPEMFVSLCEEFDKGVSNFRNKGLNISNVDIGSIEEIPDDIRGVIESLAKMTKAKDLADSDDDEGWDNFFSENDTIM